MYKKNDEWNSMAILRATSNSVFMKWKVGLRKFWEMQLDFLFSLQETGGHMFKMAAL